MLLFMLFACANKDTADETTLDTAPPSPEQTSEPEPDSVEPSITLEEGTWAYSNVSTVESDCGFPTEIESYLEQSLMSVRYNLNYVADQNYHLTLLLEEAEQVPTTCILTGTDFTCDPIIFENPTYDSLVTETYTSTGVATSSTRVEGIISKEHICDGPDCDDIAERNFMTFPCTIQFSYTFNFFD